ncbi:hypothetical protein [Brucella suis]|uniref:Uncharacterized protein n=1 Tax=Brucella suis (strain ATCC 23445 / NCTC 10510) TaxID=470137 RepID=A9WZ50_BRUSI|nr:hypothetical protein [Brucella suis]ABY39716.1 Hypothetical protein, conserved [Brucella suis ATCC 23445]
MRRCDISCSHFIAIKTLTLNQQNIDNDGLKWNESIRRHIWFSLIGIYGNRICWEEAADYSQVSVVKMTPSLFGVANPDLE